ncbi:septum formation initiator family protein [Propionibacterium acidifaciens]|uniref:FtsB family cell division protein n=1 Tax=Propionibacterium acidifaciens TaxID=556499 RepID=UPI0023F0B433|nr:septum formation initiator family protein [Propionibacterium acidifaciens]
MASPRSGKPSSGRPTAGDTPARRTARRTARRASRDRDRVQVQAGPQATSGEDGVVEPEDSHGGIHLTRRLVAVLLAGAMVVVPIVSNLTVYLNQRRQMAQARAQIAASDEHIDELLDEQERWSDPDHVRAQARARLGWVLPGEVGFQVVDENGSPYGGGSSIDRTGASTTEDQPWWERLWNSVDEADTPTGAPSTADDGQIVTGDGAGAAPTPGG